MRSGPLGAVRQGRQNLFVQPRRPVPVPSSSQAASPLAAQPADARHLHLDNSRRPRLPHRARPSCRVAEISRRGTMGWNNPPVPWREFERRLSWRQADKRAEVSDAPGGDGPRGDGSGGVEAGKHDDGNPDVRRLRPVTRLPVERRRPKVLWAELHCHSSYSFLDGASAPEELIAEAVARELTAIAITDHDGMYGVPQFAQAAARLRNGGSWPDDDGARQGDDGSGLGGESGPGGGPGTDGGPGMGGKP